VRGGPCDDTGSVTVEFAVVLPAILLVTALVVGASAASAQSVRLADAAAVVARQTARGDAGRVGAVLQELAPGASVQTQARGDLVCVVLRRPVDVGPLTGVVVLTSRSCAPALGA
jgi:hypothetical protein